MMTEAVTVIGGVVLAAILVATILYDLRQMRIPNALTFVLLGLFAATMLTNGAPSDLVSRLILSAIVFTAGFAGFVLRTIGGGDVKILSALVLFVPLSVVSEILLVFSLTLIVSTFAVLLSRRMAASPTSEWAFLRCSKMPMGLAIGSAGLLSMWMLGAGYIAT